MISYIQRFDDPAIPPPYKFTDVTIMSFQLPAKLANLQKLCDDLLNIGSLADRGFEYRAFTDFVDLEIVNYPEMIFDKAPYSGWGFATQQELYFRFYVWRFDLFDGLLFPSLFPQLFFPYIYVDNPWSMVSGRNVIGFPKAMAQFKPTQMLGVSPLQITASTMAMEIHSPTTKLKLHPIVEINTDQTAIAPALPGNGAWPWFGLASATSIFDPYIKQQSQTFLAKLPSLFSTVQLKQFRDFSTDACFQAVVETPFEPSNVGLLKPLPPVSVTVHSYASLDIPGDLGFPSGQPLQPAQQYSVSLNMRMSGGRDLFINR